MLPVVGAFRGLFLGSVLVWYSSSVWKTMDNYYNQEFKKYLQKEKQARRFPTDDDVCRAAPDAACAHAGPGPSHDAPSPAAPDASSVAEALARSAAPADTVTAAAAKGVEEALAQSTAPDVREGDGGGGCTVGRDVTHTGEWRRRSQEAARGCGEGDGGGEELPPGDDPDTCPAVY